MKQSIHTSLQIDTPENVTFQYKVAGIGSRFLAALIDTLLIFVIQVFLIGIILLIWAAEATPGPDLRPSTWLIALLSLIASSVMGGYYIFFEMQWNGKSPGKRVVGLQVIRSNGTSITLTESLIRNLIRLVDFLPTNYAVGVITMFIDNQSRRLGDIAAGTLVILEQSKVTLESLEGATRFRSAQVSQTLTVNWPIHRLDDEDLELIVRFLQRREELSNRATLAREILKPLLEKMDLPPTQVTTGESERVLTEIAAAMQAEGDRETLSDLSA